jgi:hypothetical protein
MAGLETEIVEDIDDDGDGRADFQVALNPGQKTATWKAYSLWALKFEGPYQIGDGLGIRVTLKR